MLQSPAAGVLIDTSLPPLLAYLFWGIQDDPAAGVAYNTRYCLLPAHCIYDGALL